MTALTKHARKSGGMPEEWLRNIQRKSSTYAKRVSQISSEYKRANAMEAGVQLTKKESAANDLREIGRGKRERRDSVCAIEALDRIGVMSGSSAAVQIGRENRRKKQRG